MDSWVGRGPLLAGMRDIAPILVGVLPFAAIVGATAFETGLSRLEGVAMSMVVFAGAAQLATIDLLGRAAALPVVVATALVINARFLMYSASMAPHLVGLGRGRTAVVGYLLTDQAYAFSILRFTSERLPIRHRFAYYLGLALPMWLTWQAGTMAGVVFGAAVPPELSLEFAIPLVFTALLVPAIRAGSELVAAGVGGLLAIAAAGMPYHLGVLVAALAGVGAGAGMARSRS